MIEEDIKRKHQFILNKNRLLLDLKNFKGEIPLVSIVIPNRNGLSHLKTLFKKFEENTCYPNFEIIVVDNASTDDSLFFLDELSISLPLRIIKNQQNKSFSEANNQAVKEAKGEYILLLNNDTEPTYGWLNQMMQIALRSDDIGAVGAKLVYPYTEGDPNSFKVQHVGIVFKPQNDFIRPHNLGQGKDAFYPLYNMEEVRAGVTAAALLIRKDLYLEVGGLEDGYNYGYEDVDFCLKLNKAGYKNIYCPNALLFHHENATQKKDHKLIMDERRTNNHVLLQRKWRLWLRKRYLKDILDSEGLFSERPLKISILVGGKLSVVDDSTRKFGNSMEKLGWEVIYQVVNGKEGWSRVPNDVDIFISFNEDYDLDKIICKNKLLIKIAFVHNGVHRWISNPSLNKFDLIFTHTLKEKRLIEKAVGAKSQLLPIISNHNDYIQTFKEVLKHELVIKTNIAIKIPATQWRGIERCEDYHLALSLKKEFERNNYDVMLQILPEWDDDKDCDVVIVLRGPVRYKPKKHNFNILWNISNPDMVSLEEYEEYDHVYVASNIWAETLKAKLRVPVESLLHCTDPEFFYPNNSRQYEHELLYVESSRNELKQIINDVIPTDKDLGLYGTNWGQSGVDEYICGDHIPNISLHKAYSSSKILLIDHSEDMQDKGFISNRFFDGFASGVLIISDEICGAREVFGDALITYSNPVDLREKIDYYLDHEEERKELVSKVRDTVLDQHTIEKRVEQILENNNFYK